MSSDPIAALDCAIRIKVLGRRALRRHRDTIIGMDVKRTLRELTCEINELRGARRQLVELRRVVPRIRELAA